MRSKPKRYRITTLCPEETFRFGTFLGQQLTSGAVIALHGELGSGKTCLTQGIANGLHVPKDFYITSPSYTLVNEYPGRIRLFHMDLYRMGDISELDDIGFHEILAVDGVVVIEWADKFPSALPKERLDLSFTIVDDQRRQLYLTGYGSTAEDLAKACFEYFQSTAQRKGLEYPADKGKNVLDSP
jgi:tRNA threonylcarbamoyladenosine biosynthesis protein TsaE